MTRILSFPSCTSNENIVIVLELSADEALTATGVHNGLDDWSIDRTGNSVCHHINELRDAGLIDVIRSEEGHGTLRSITPKI